MVNLPRKKDNLSIFYFRTSNYRAKKLTFELKTPFDTALQANNSVALLPMLDIFRTIDWRKIKQEIEPFRITME